MDFRAQIKTLMKQRQLSGYAVAKGAGLKTRATLYNYLNGDSDMTVQNLEKILQFLRSGVPVKQ